MVPWVVPMVQTIGILSWDIRAILSCVNKKRVLLGKHMLKFLYLVILNNIHSTDGNVRPDILLCVSSLRQIKENLSWPL